MRGWQQQEGQIEGLGGGVTQVNNSMRSKQAQLTSGALWRSCRAGNESLRKNCIFHWGNGEHVLIDAMLCQPEVIHWLQLQLAAQPRAWVWCSDMSHSLSVHVCLLWYVYMSLCACTWRVGFHFSPSVWCHNISNEFSQEHSRWSTFLFDLSCFENVPKYTCGRSDVCVLGLFNFT